MNRPSDVIYGRLYFKKIFLWRNKCSIMRRMVTVGRPLASIWCHYFKIIEWTVGDYRVQTFNQKTELLKQSSRGPKFVTSPCLTIIICNLSTFGTYSKIRITTFHSCFLITWQIIYNWKKNHLFQKVNINAYWSVKGYLSPHFMIKNINLYTSFNHHSECFKQNKLYDVVYI